jgi:spectrin beta
VEKLMRKHEDFEKMLIPQLGRVEELEKFASAVLSEGHADAASIESRLAAVCGRRDKLRSSAFTRRNKLVESRRLHQFLRNVLEVEGWLHEKQQVAGDENYRDSTNLQSKIQKHLAFESELSANKGRVSAVTSEGSRPNNILSIFLKILSSTFDFFSTRGYE